MEATGREEAGSDRGKRGSQEVLKPVQQGNNMK